MSYWILSLTIEGLGKVSTTIDELYRFSTAPAPDLDVSSVYIEGLELYPPEIGSSIDFRSSTATLSGLSATLIDATGAIAPKLYNQVPVQVASLTTTAISSSDTTIRTDDAAGALEGSVVCLERECIFLGDHFGGGEYWNPGGNDLKRGVLGTLASAHGVDASSDVSIFLSETFPIPLHRKVQLRRVLSTGSSYDDEEILWTGLLTSIDSPSPEVIRIEAEDVLSVIQDREIWPTRWGGSLRGGSIEGEPISASGDLTVKIDELTALTDLEYDVGSDNRVNIGSGWSWVRQGSLMSGAQRATLDEIDQASEMTEILPCTGTGSTSSLPPSSNVFSLILQLLTTTRGGGNGAYDLGDASRTHVGEEIGLGIPASLVDITGIETLRDVSYGPAYCVRQRLTLGLEDKISVNELFTTLLAPLLCTFTVNSSGAFTIIGMIDNPSDTPESIAQASTMPEPRLYQSRRLYDPIDLLEVTLDQRIGIGVRDDSFRDGIHRRRNPYGDESKVSLDLSSFDTAHQHYAHALAKRVMKRWHVGIPEVTLDMLRTASIYPGTLFYLTHDKVYQATTGGRGVTEGLFLCTARRLELSEGIVKLRALYVGAVYARVGRIAPCAKVSSWSSGSRTFTCATSTFSSSISDFSGMGATHKLYLTDRYHALRLAASLEVESLDIDTGEIVVTAASATALSSAGVTPQANDLLKLADYDDNTDKMKDLYAFIADSTDNLIGSSNDNAYEWSL